MLKYLSLFSGIEAASCAWGNLPMFPVGFSEVEPFCCNVLAKHYPQIPNLGDVTKITAAQLKALGRIDLIVGGSPCQGFSLAGKMKGLEDERSKLALSFANIIGVVRPRWILWENVPGVLRTNRGMDFRCFIKVLTELGYELSWRILDAQYFGVPQRRRRLYLVGYLGDYEPPRKVLFEQACVQGDTPQGCGTQCETPAVVGEAIACASRDACLDMSHACDVIRYHLGQTPTLTARMGTGGNNIPLVSSWVHPNQTDWKESPIANTCCHRDFKSPQTLVATPRLRKLTPRECLRLQGFPDYWFNDIEKYSDTAAYKAIGNSMAVPVMHWIGRRICDVSGCEGFFHCD